MSKGRVGHYPSTKHSRLRKSKRAEGIRPEALLPYEKANKPAKRPFNMDQFKLSWHFVNDSDQGLYE